MKYRKKPVEIDAELLTVDNMVSVAKWVGASEYWGLDAPSPGIFIETLEGLMKANLGDYVICGVDGEFYPCKPHIFEQTYERVE